jgi:hypothetical protein
LLFNAPKILILPIPSPRFRKKWVIIRGIVNICVDNKLSYQLQCLFWIYLHQDGLYCSRLLQQAHLHPMRRLPVHLLIQNRNNHKHVIVLLIAIGLHCAITGVHVGSVILVVNDGVVITVAAVQFSCMCCKRLLTCFSLINLTMNMSLPVLQLDST